jgi:hypothetical protein
MSVSILYYNQDYTGGIGEDQSPACILPVISRSFVDKLRELSVCITPSAFPGFFNLPGVDGENIILLEKLLPSQ